MNLILRNRLLQWLRDTNVNPVIREFLNGSLRDKETIIIDGLTEIVCRVTALPAT